MASAIVANIDAINGCPGKRSNNRPPSMAPVRYPVDLATKTVLRAPRDTPVNSARAGRVGPSEDSTSPRPTKAQ